jgi:formylglycine-generating enzyme required for sulfatase activity/predicted Ser/Thr protein kinase
VADFAILLQRYRAGELSSPELLLAVDRSLQDGPVDCARLLAILADESRKPPLLPLQVRYAITRRVNAAARRGSESDVSEVDLDATATTLREPQDLSPLPSTLRDATDHVGRILKRRFTLLECINQGGMSTVYKAVDQRKLEALASEPYVAVKIMKADLSRHPDAFAVLQREAEKSQALGHPNIVRVFDCDRDGETVFMTMEYLSGRALKRSRLANGPEIQKEEALRIIADIGTALAFAHRNGVVHGDLKPSNVMITDTGVVKVIDFGIARVLPQRLDQRTSTKPDAGTINAVTPRYASPEMLEGREPDPRDDVYGLACVAYWLLTGNHPFGGDSSTVARDAGLKPPLHPKLSRREHRALAAALDFSRETRTPTVERVLDDMRPRERRIQWLAAVVAAAAIAIAMLLWAGLPAPDESAAQRAATDAPAAAGANEIFRDCDVCPQMSVIPAGGFTQGSYETDPGFHPSEAPAHDVTIGRKIAIGRYEVTLGEYQAFAEETGHTASGCDIYDGEWRVSLGHDWGNAAYAQASSHPVTCVSWDDAQAYVAWLSDKTAKPYRLPTAAEWEYSARAGAGPAPGGSGALAATAAGTEPACGYANVADRAAAERYEGWAVHDCTDGYVYTAPVGSFAPNAFGLHDMLGNVFEWVADCWHDDYTGAPADGSTRQGGDCAQRELRGGSWFTVPSGARAAYRNRFAADHRSNSFGFRVARDVTQ